MTAATKALFILAPFFALCESVNVKYLEAASPCAEIESPGGSPGGYGANVIQRTYVKPAASCVGRVTFRLLRMEVGPVDGFDAATCYYDSGDFIRVTQGGGYSEFRCGSATSPAFPTANNRDHIQILFRSNGNDNNYAGFRLKVCASGCPTVNGVTEGEHRLTAAGARCIVVVSPNYPNSYDPDRDLTTTVLFPSPPCGTQVSFSFMQTFDLAGGGDCTGSSSDKLTLTAIAQDGTIAGQIAKYCYDANSAPTVSDQDSGLKGVRIRFKSFDNDPGQGFGLTVCAKC